MHASKRLQQHIVIENDHKDERVKAIEVSNPDDMSQSEVFEAIKELGLIGLGGSDFQHILNIHILKILIQF